MKDTLTYKKSVTDPNIDEVIATSSYSINDVELVNTSNQYDKYKRITDKTNTIQETSFKKVYAYDKDKLNEVKTYLSDNLQSSTQYTYDSLNRISSITLDNKTISYEYDDYGRLKRENNEPLDKTIIYDYNDIGNIVTNNTYQYTVDANPSTLLSSKSYTYDSTNKDRLINFNGTDILYDTLGCPTTLNGYNLTWSNGKLTKYAKGNAIIGLESNTYSYNAYGQRVSKVYSKTAGRDGLIQLYEGEITSCNKNYNYDHSGRLINETGQTTYYQLGTYNESIDYIYDVNTIIGMRYTKDTETSIYYYDRNVFGDVVGIYDINGNLKVKYVYDAYGNCTISNETTDQTLARLNPIRYRGYYYDVETNLFLVSSRYYSPELCRWISPDDIEYLDPESVNGLNLYCYCLNNPVMCR